MKALGNIPFYYFLPLPHMASWQ